MTNQPQAPVRGPGNDGRYDHTKPGERRPQYTDVRPYSASDEAQIARAQQSVLAPGHVLQDYVRPNLPQVNLFPPRFGSRDWQLGINDIVDVAEIYQAPRSAFAGGPAGYQGAARNSWNSGSW